MLAQATIARSATPPHTIQTFFRLRIDASIPRWGNERYYEFSRRKVSFFTAKDSMNRKSGSGSSVDCI
jgi:hypothetical protein